MKLPLAIVLSSQFQAFHSAAIQPRQIHVWPDLPALAFIQFDFQSGTAVRFGARLPLGTPRCSFLNCVRGPLCVFSQHSHQLALTPPDK